MHRLDDEPSTAPVQPGPPDDPASFVRRHQVSVFRFLRAAGCPAHAAEEVAQDALLLALERRIADDQAPGFLRQAAKFLWLRRMRDEGRAQARLLDAADRLWQRDCADDDGDGLIAALRTCVEALPERSRLAIERVYRDGIGREQLAVELEIGEHGARTLLQRVRAHLRDCIERRLER
ncbi:MAG: sigma factor-like helix-turn-helix DNA-binding protein [Planctomycetota bacterium]